MRAASRSALTRTSTATPQMRIRAPTAAEVVVHQRY
jgi:hypothetical protein